LLVVLFAVLVATDRLFWQPSTDANGPVDAIVVLGGEGPRIPRAVELGRRLKPLALVVSGVEHIQVCRNISGAAGVPTSCFVASPSSTQGEAREVARLAVRNGWRSLLLVTTTEQAVRARVRVERCWSGDLAVTTVPLPTGAALRATAYEWGALAKAELWQRGC